MKRIVLVGLIFCTFTAHANVVPLTLNYVGDVYSNCRRGDDVYTLSGTTTNGSVNRYDTTYPYSGGSLISNPTAVITLDSIEVVTIFSRNYTDPINAECWGGGYLLGTIEIGETLNYPSGTPLDLRVDYIAANFGDEPSDTYKRWVIIGDQDYNTIWEADYLTGSNYYIPSNVESYFIPIVAGATYHFQIWEEAGSLSNPIVSWDKLHAGTAVGLGFSVVPEPATLSLLGLGAFLIRRKK